ncbi:holo-ACP synthase [Globicatella sulfidifaciens DSM 15739]|uniref:citrate lyase holo-[acyl-carrier protein] synthase n=1 Tax=Globicatella sulfidifaciens DSM 15739 TaxID=1121925 RepID=A0A1T4JTH3_9LACT|nr:holo-ACP synthase [Globicatella sulfidifaciens DSM 15739]
MQLLNIEMAQLLTPFAMSNNQVFDGESVTLLEMLHAREERQELQRNIFLKAPQGTLLSITMNIPGEIKNSKILKRVFECELNNLKSKFSKETILTRFVSNKAGNEAYILLSINPVLLKKRLIKYEEESQLGRLLDLDVHYKNKENIFQISRTEIGYPPRKCFLCDNIAKECGRSRSHSLDDIRLYISKKVLKYLEENSN